MTTTEELTPQGSSSPRIVVMTGGSTGFGAHAAKYIATQPDTRLIIGAEDGSPTPAAGAAILPVDLCSLDSVRRFAATVIKQIGDARINVLVLNAYLQRVQGRERSVDGFEAVFAANHLAHYLLVRLLLPYVADGGRIVILSSGMHDPRLSPAAPKTVEPYELAHARPEGFGAGMRTYAASKVCNLLTAGSLTRLDETRERRISVIAFNPGLAGDDAPTGAVSVGRRALRGVLRALIAIVGRFRPEYIVGTPQRSGELLGQICLGEIDAPAGHIYISQVKGHATFPAPSALAGNQQVQDTLWRDSAALVGITE